MRFSSFSGAHRAVSLLLLAFLLAASLLWVWHIAGMQQGGAMESCLLAGGRIMLCALSSAGQIGLWQGMFAAVLPLAAAVLAVAAILLKPHGGAVRASDRERGLSAIPAWLIQRFRDWLPPEPLRELLSQGILHPKIYES